MTMELFDLTGKVAVVTGGSRGIGRAICLRLAQHGARVVVSSRKLDACQQVVDEISSRGGTAVARACHIARKEDLQALVDSTEAQWGAIDILVCNAAVNPYFGLCNMVLPGMARRGRGGSVIIISSVGGFQGSNKIGAYNISKAADMQLARNIAIEWGRQAIRANCIAPGLVKTDFARALWEDPGILARTVKHSPLQRIGEPDEIAGAAVFLASPASGFMTGQTMVIDGGRLAGYPHIDD
jgi:NAD(P)-dependent dehydrogenase (short-subunit alcohol dehydrogenase family)